MIDLKIKVGVSNRHVHLTKEDVEVLFGEDYELTPLRYLDQPMQYAAKETVTLKTKYNTKDHVRVVGPVRNYTQVELLDVDKKYFKINPPIRNSGDLSNSESITIIGPKGSIYKENICIIATTHIHINTEAASCFKQDEIVSVKVGDNILNDVHIRISPDYALALHMNKDEAIEKNIQTGDIAILKED